MKAIFMSQANRFTYWRSNCICSFILFLHILIYKEHFSISLSIINYIISDDCISFQHWNVTSFIEPDCHRGTVRELPVLPLHFWEF